MTAGNTPWSRGWSRVVALTTHAALTGAAGTVAVQATIQLAGFASAILVMRWTDQQQYALYTLALSLLGALSALADSGVAANVMAQGGRVWRDRVALGAVLAAGNYIRNRLGITVCLIGIPMAVFLTNRKFEGSASSLASLAAVVIAFVCYQPSIILEAPLKLHQDLRVLLQFRLGSNALRVVATVVAAMVAPFAWAIILAGALAQAVSNIFLRQLAARRADLSQKPAAEGLRELKHIVGRSLPGALYYSVQSQASLWLLATLGVTQSVAELGALGRLAAIATLATVAFDTVVAPRFARQPPAAVRRLFFKILALSGMVLVAAAFVCSSLSTVILALLGDKYRHLGYEFSILCAATAVSLVTSFSWSMNAARAYLPPWFVYPTVGTLCYVAFCLIFGVDTLTAALHVQLACAIAGLLTNLVVFQIKSRTAA